MNTKKLLSIAIMLALPFGARADYTHVSQNTPVQVANNGTVTISSYSAPYQTVAIENDDDEHIASTSYVKGAYNDLIAGINSVNIRISDNAAGVDDVFEEIRETISSKRVKIYTTWDDDRDSATTQVALETFVPED